LGSVPCKVVLVKKHTRSGNNLDVTTNASIMAARHVVQALQMGEPVHPGI